MRTTASLNRTSNPRRVIVGDQEAYFWDVVVDGVPNELAWWVTDGTLRLSYPLDETRRSSFIRLGARYSPQRNLNDADAAVRRWVCNQHQRLAS